MKKLLVVIMIAFGAVSVAQGQDSKVIRFTNATGFKRNGSDLWFNMHEEFHNVKFPWISSCKVTVGQRVIFDPKENTFLIDKHMSWVSFVHVFPIGVWLSYIILCALVALLAINPSIMQSEDVRKFFCLIQITACLGINLGGSLYNALFSSFQGWMYVLQLVWVIVLVTICLANILFVLDVFSEDRIVNRRYGVVILIPSILSIWLFTDGSMTLLIIPIFCIFLFGFIYGTKKIVVLFLSKIWVNAKVN